MAEHSVMLCIGVIFQAKDDKAISKVRCIMDVANKFQKFLLIEMVKEWMNIISSDNFKSRSRDVM